jgi:SAM-dependent methyltransferase
VTSPLPVPPLQMRELVGPTDPAAFDNPTGAPVWPDLPASAYESVLDLGCGCGRVARQLLQQDEPPQRYLGIDLHRGMVEWCTANLAPAHPGFRFVHHDVYEMGFNPAGTPTDQLVALPVPDGGATLVVAWSVFTHLLEHQIPHYLREVARALRPDGIMRTTWFLFDKRYFPMMQPFQNCLYINAVNPTNAVIVDRSWLLGQLAGCGLTTATAQPPSIRGFQWTVDLRHARPGEVASLPEVDEAPFGSSPPPVGAADAHLIGLGGDAPGG